MNKTLKFLLTVLLIFAMVFALSCTGKEESKERDESITITFTVVHGDKSEKNFTIETNARYLRGALEQENLVSGDESEYGLFVKTVDGETVDFSANESWWCLYEGDEQALSGIDSLEIKDGGTYSFVYTIGY